MNDQDFQRFLRAARTMWPDALGAWLDDLPKAGDGNFLDVVALWRSTLARTEIEHALETLHAIFEGRIQLPGGEKFPRWSMLPAVVARTVRDRIEVNRGPRFVDGQPTCRCPLCFDQGFVTVWERDAVEAAEQGQLPVHMRNPRARKTGAVPCSCEVGRRIAAKLKRACYAPRRDRLAPAPITDAAIAALESDVMGAAFS